MIVCSVQTPPYSLALDVTSKLPVAFTTVSSADSAILDKIVRNASKVPPTPGKFYSKEAALSILDTLRTDGACAKVVPAPNATESDVQKFEKFSQRLSDDELVRWFSALPTFPFSDEFRLVVCDHGWL